MEVQYGVPLVDLAMRWRCRVCHVESHGCGMPPNTARVTLVWSMLEVQRFLFRPCDVPFGRYWAADTRVADDEPPFDYWQTSYSY
jgi:hypothetical protein